MSLHPPVASGQPARGTVLVLPGRGESPEFYLRFGHRIASDGYRVSVVDAPPVTDSVDSLDSVIESLADALDGLADEPPRPLTLVSGDTDALAALAARPVGLGLFRPDALVLLSDEIDPLADLEALTALTTRLPRARVAVLRGADHDVRDATAHPSVAAEVVAFLENLRGAPVLTPLAAVPASAR